MSRKGIKHTIGWKIAERPELDRKILNFKKRLDEVDHILKSDKKKKK